MILYTREETYKIFYTYKRLPSSLNIGLDVIELLKDLRYEFEYGYIETRDDFEYSYNCHDLYPLASYQFTFHNNHIYKSTR
jgi:hypothetical protein